MQPNNPVNPYARTPQSYGGQPMQYPQQMPPQTAQPGYTTPINMQTTQPRYQAGSVPMATPKPVAQSRPTESANTLRMADGTVLPEVIYVKKKGAIIGFVITSVLLVACAVYAVYTTLQLKSHSSETSDLSSQVEERDAKLETVRKALNFESVDDLTEEKITSLLGSYGNAVDINLSSFGTAGGIYINWVRASADQRYFVANVNYYGSNNYYYETYTDRSWRLAFSTASTVSCRDITKAAMEAVSYVGGVDKSESSTGTKYDCLDPEDGDKLYDFPDAIAEGVYKQD